MPSTPFMGVRISWLIVARNWDLARLASSARSLARRSSAVRRSTVSSISARAVRSRSKADVVASRSALAPWMRAPISSFPCPAGTFMRSAPPGGMAWSCCASLTMGRDTRLCAAAYSIMATMTTRPAIQAANVSACWFAAPLMCASSPWMRSNPTCSLRSKGEASGLSTDIAPVSDIPAFFLLAASSAPCGDTTCAVATRGFWASPSTTSDSSTGSAAKAPTASVLSTASARPSMVARLLASALSCPRR